eukprot:GGOE01044728.1.p1 GENE.GGOE01044728.1~~GGOE01044728.1.p1  ORF type:complete len:533 (-),score=165.56 GGOE01044728.1:178-1776(-)
MDISPLLELFPNLAPSLVEATFRRNERDVNATIADLLQMGTCTKKRKKDTPLQQLLAMGFSSTEARAALADCSSVEAAVSTLLAGDAEQEEERAWMEFALDGDVDAQGPAPAKPPSAGKGKKARAKSRSHPMANGGPESASSSSASQPRVPLPPTEVLLQALQRYTDAVGEMAKHPTQLQAAPRPIAGEDQALLVAVYDEMIDCFNKSGYHRKYGCHSAETALTGIQAGQPVPSYYANVQQGSIYARKLLSLLGLRNLILHGPAIFHEFREQLFASDPSKYPPQTGLHKMRYYTGNTVDLDTVVLRCNDSAALKVINELNKADGKPAVQIAVDTTTQLVAGFIDDFKLSKTQQKQRRVDPNQINPNKIPVAQDNSSRGLWPLWRYINVSAGVDTFHANVPCMAEVTGALLKAPMAAVRAYLQCRDDPQCLAAFYEEGISDTCFNGKWKALEAFNDALDKRGSINAILADLQAANQQLFTEAFFAADDDESQNEVREMVRLVDQRTGRDKEGRVRPVSVEDVRQWVKDPGKPV